MLIARYLIKETVKSQIAVFFILMTIFITLRFVRVLGDASDGDIPANLVVGFLALYAPVLASLVLPISAYLGVMLAHGRLHVDSEMTVFKACGTSEWYVTRVMLVLSIAVMILAAAITFYLSPTAAKSEYTLRQKAQSEAGVSTLIPGRFQPTGNKQAIIFAHDIDSENAELQRVFLSQNTSGDEEVRVVYATDGKVETGEDGTRYLILNSGNQYEGIQGQANYRLLTFDEYRIQIGTSVNTQAKVKTSTLSTAELWQDGSPESLAELHWRLAIPLSIPLLMIIAVPLAAVNPRQGRFGKMVPAILLSLGYFLLLLASRRVLEDGKLPSELGLWWVHFIVLVIGIGLLIRDRKTGTWLRSTIVRKLS